MTVLEGLVFSRFTALFEDGLGVAFASFEPGVATLPLDGDAGAFWFLSGTRSTFCLDEAALRGLFMVEALLVSSFDCAALELALEEAAERDTLSEDLTLRLLAGSLLPTDCLCEYNTSPSRLFSG